MSVLLILVLFSTQFTILVESNFMDNNFDNRDGLSLQDQSDFATMHKIKCTINSNMPFDQYTPEKYNTTSKTFQFCDLDELELKYSEMQTNPPHYIYDIVNMYPQMQVLFKCIKESSHINENIPALKKLTDDYYDHLQDLTDDVENSKIANKKILNEKFNLGKQLEQARQQTEYIDNNEKIISKLLSSIQKAMNVCNGNIVNDIAVYKNIVSSYNITERLENSYNEIVDNVENIRDICDEFVNIPQMDPIITVAYQKYLKIIHSLINFDSEPNKIQIPLSDRLEAITELLRDNNPTCYQILNITLQNPRELIKNLESDYTRAEERNNEAKILIEQIVTKTTDLTIESQSMLNSTISNLENHIKLMEHLDSNKQNWITMLDNINATIVDISLQKKEFLSDKVNDREYLELFKDVLKALRVMEGRINFKDKSPVSELCKYSKIPQKSELSVNHTMFYSYQMLYSNFKVELKKLTDGLIKDQSAIKNYLNLLVSEMKNLNNQYDSLSKESIVEVDKLHKEDNIVITQKPSSKNELHNTLDTEFLNDTPGVTVDTGDNKEISTKQDLTKPNENSLPQIYSNVTNSTKNDPSIKDIKSNNSKSSKEIASIQSNNKDKRDTQITKSSKNQTSKTLIFSITTATLGIAIILIILVFLINKKRLNKFQKFKSTKNQCDIELKSFK